MNTLAKQIWHRALWTQFNLFALDPRAFIHRLYQVGNRSFWIVAGVTFFTGAALCQQAATQAMQLLGDQSIIGPEYIVLAFKSFGPLVVALALMSKVGAAFAEDDCRPGMHKEQQAPSPTQTPPCD